MPRRRVRRAVRPARGSAAPCSTLTSSGSTASRSLLPEAVAALASAGRVQQVAAGIATGADGVLRIGTSQGLGDRLDRVLDGLRLPVRLRSLALADRLAAVRAGELDAAFVRILRTAPGLELIPLWIDPLAAALPAAHPLAALPALSLAHLAALPLRLAPRQDNRPFHDLITQSGVQLRMAAPFTTVQDTLAEIGTGEPSWTVLYAAVADATPTRRVAFRPLTAPEAVTSLAVPPGPPSPALRRLLHACATADH